MSMERKDLLCRYHYDPLDRLADCTPATQASTQRFYLKNRLTSEIQGSVQRSIFQHDDQLLAQQQREDEISRTTLLTTDQQRSVLQMLDAAHLHTLAYTAYGHRPHENGLLSLLGFNGERPDPVTGHYLLGNGYRAFNPVLMRFNSPDSLSPFGKGGLNAYAYCLGDPVNRSDPSGHFPNVWKGFLNLVGLRTPQRYKALAPPQEIATTVGIFNSPPTAAPSASRIANSISHTRSATELGAFGKIEGMPHILEDIVSYLPGSDLVSLASTSQAMKQKVYSMARSPVGLFKPELGEASIDGVKSAARGRMNGIVPAHAIDMTNAHQQKKRVMTTLRIRGLVAREEAYYANFPSRDNSGRRHAIYLPD
jgi:RHS repeat-associated protein